MLLLDAKDEHVRHDPEDIAIIDGESRWIWARLDGRNISRCTPIDHLSLAHGW